MSVIKVQIKSLPKQSVLRHCRKLIKDGVDPETRLEAYRGDTLCLIVKKIEEGAKWAVEENQKVGPRFVKYKPFPSDIMADKGRR